MVVIFSCLLSIFWNDGSIVYERAIFVKKFERVKLFSADFELDSHGAAFLKLFRCLDALADGHQVAAVFWEQRSLPFGFADPHMDRDHAPAIRHKLRDRFDVTALFFRNGHEEIGRGTSPVKDLACEFKDHIIVVYQMSKGCTPDRQIDWLSN